ncbi:hypothetical protein CDAR_16261 [Caerostris darwini]|uniref:Uncharacterized protein n=1 Tax=Caerostris darwini TaxID=1538125 RepID=A0AAV4WT72_9ARAC|nr:hypothetical protein CDAR_16261 [Caerostris darwini]
MTTETEYVFARSEIEVHRKLFLGTVCDLSRLFRGDSSEVQLQMLSSEDETSLVFDVVKQKLDCGKFDFHYEQYGPRILQCVLLPTKWDLLDEESLYDTLTLHCELIVAAGVVSEMVQDTLLEDRNFEAECSSSIECILGSNWMEFEQENRHLAVEAFRHLFFCLKRQIEWRPPSWEECR